MKRISMSALLIAFILTCGGCSFSNNNEMELTSEGITSEELTSEERVETTTIQLPEEDDPKTEDDQSTTIEESEETLTPVLSKEKFEMVGEMLSVHHSNWRRNMILYGLLEVGGRHREGEHSFCIFYNTKEQSYYLGYEENEPSQEGENGYAFSDIKLVWDEGRNTVHMVTGGICKSKYDNIIVYEGKYQVMDSDSGIYEPFDEKEIMLIELWKCMLRCIDYQGLNENGEDYVNWNENYNVELFLEGFTEYETDYQIQALYDQEKWLSHLIIGNADYSVWADTLRVDKGWEFISISFIDRYRRYAQDAALFLYGSISKQICEERVGETEGLANCNLWGSALKGIGQYFYNKTGSIYGHLTGEIYLVDIIRTQGVREVIGEYVFALEGEDPVRMTLVYEGTDLTKFSVSYSDYANEMDELEGIAGMKFDLVTAKEK